MASPSPPFYPPGWNDYNEPATTLLIEWAVSLLVIAPMLVGGVCSALWLLRRPGKDGQFLPADANRPLLDDTAARRLLLFTGVINTNWRCCLCCTTSQLWCLCGHYFKLVAGGMVLASLGELALLFVFPMGGVAIQSMPWLLAILFSALTASCSWWHLGHVLKTLPSTPARSVQQALNVSLGFAAVIFVASCTLVAAWEIPRYGFMYQPYIGPLMLLICNANTAPLAATVLVLSTEVTAAREDVGRLIESARVGQLRCQDYIEVRDKIGQRSHIWRRFLFALTAVALMCSVTLVVAVHIVSRVGAADTQFAVVSGEQYVLMLGKEMLLLVVLVQQVASINDAADVIPAFLVDMGCSVDASPADVADQARLLHLTQISAMDPKTLHSFRAYVLAPRRGPISFRLAGVRVTRGWLTATVLSLVGGFAVPPLLKLLINASGAFHVPANSNVSFTN